MTALELPAREAAGHFAFSGRPISCEPFGSGHINDTFRVACREEAGRAHAYLLQRISRSAFPDPWALMANIQGVTRYLRRKIEAAGGDPERETLNLVPTESGGCLYVDRRGGCWRAYRFIPDAVSFDRAGPDVLHECAEAFGRFQRLLAEYPIENLHVTVPDFHNTPARLAALAQAVKQDPVGRVGGVLPEIGFIGRRAAEADMLARAGRAGRIPLRVTHNDTKLNNVLFDRRSGRALCVVDLDTIMPGYSAYDFGDGIRFGASTADEDERDLSKVRLDCGLYAMYLDGYLDGCAGILTDEEIRMLPVGAKLMTFECGVRFLTDYLTGDAYFKTERPAQNLDRCRTQLELVADMERKWDKLTDLGRRYLGRPAPA